MTVEHALDRIGQLEQQVDVYAAERAKIDMKIEACLRELRELQEVVEK